jgi:hypothetical protein
MQRYDYYTIENVFAVFDRIRGSNETIARCRTRTDAELIVKALNDTIKPSHLTTDKATDWVNVETDMSEWRRWAGVTR